MSKKYELESLLMQRDHSERVISILTQRIKHLDKVIREEEQEIDKLLYSSEGV